MARVAPEKSGPYRPATPSQQGINKGLIMRSRRKLVFGVGINDGPPGAYSTKPYKTWHNMLKRCYCDAYQETQPTYKGCFVCDEWLTLSNFMRWLAAQDWEGKELDKDLLHPGNKEYSPEKCVFVTRQINSLLHIRVGLNSPQGVWFDKGAGKFRAEFIANGKKKYIGLFDDINDGAVAYKKAKANHIRKIAENESELIASALVRHADLLECES